MAGPPAPLPRPKSMATESHPPNRAGEERQNTPHAEMDGTNYQTQEYAEQDQTKPNKTKQNQTQANQQCARQEGLLLKLL